MKKRTTGIIRGFAVALFASAAIVGPASAQLTSGDDPQSTTASYSTDLARYYAPYALQAAAAYVSVKSLNDTRGPSGRPTSDGSDIKLVTADYASDKNIFDRATKYLRSWRYQFGSEGYITCLEYPPGRPDPDCQNAIQDDRWTYAISGGPSFHVWARYPAKNSVACSEVSIAFRGTDFYSVADWTANLAPTWARADDHYRQLRRNVDVIMKRVTGLDCYRKAGGAQIVSVGHSLGASLAQFAAFANSRARKRIVKVFAFNPSPVTAQSLLNQQLFASNAREVEIDRVYQSREVLQRIRTAAEWVRTPYESCRPLVRDVAFDVLQGGTSIDLHGMVPFAREIVKLSYRGEKQRDYVKPGLTKCGKRSYSTPDSDEDDYDVRPAGGDESMVVAMLRGSRPALARLNRNRIVSSSFRTDSYEMASLQPAEADRSIAKPARAKARRTARTDPPQQANSAPQWQVSYASYRE